jgi:hypothetical protein
MSRPAHAALGWHTWKGICSDPRSKIAKNPSRARELLPLECCCEPLLPGSAWFRSSLCCSDPATQLVELALLSEGRTPAQHRLRFESCGDIISPDDRVWELAMSTLVAAKTGPVRAESSLTPQKKGQSIALLDHDFGLDHENEANSSGDGIRCPLCGWSPRKNSRWMCDCKHVWNTFDTGGICPACLYQWTSTMCPSCLRWSPHSDWYAQSSNPHGR